MNNFTRFIFFFFALVTVGHAAERLPSFADRTPAYFTDRYGYAKTTRDVQVHSFVDSTKGTIRLTGRFSLREYQSDNLRITATFFLPSLKLASVTLKLPHSWTREQIDAALVAYGTNWKQTKVNIAIKEWMLPDGTKAISILNSLVIHSPEVSELIQKALTEKEAKRKAVPKF